MRTPVCWRSIKSSIVRVFGLFAFGLAFALAPQLSTLSASADTTNTNPWVPLAAIIPDPAGGAITGRTEGACTALIGGKIYVAFGYDAGSGDSRGLRIYDIASNTWALGPTPPSLSGRSEGYRGVAHGGKLYCVGGRPTAETWIFDTGTGTWAPGAPEPDPLLRVGATAATYGDNIFMFGGRHAFGGPCSGPAVTPADVDGTILRYDIDKDAWFPAGNLVHARSDATAARVGGLIYIFGGCNTSANEPDGLEIYDPRTQTSTVDPVPMPGGPRSDAAAGDPQNGSSANASHRIHIAGGEDSAGQDPKSNHIIFDVDQNSFVVGVQMPTHCEDYGNPTAGRGEHELAYGGDRIYAVGGSCPGFGNSENNLDVQKLSDSETAVASASVTASTCNGSTFPVCAVQAPGSSLVFSTGTGFKPAAPISLTSALQGSLPPAVTDVQGSFVTTYLDTVCNKQADTITATDGTNTASIPLTCS